MGEKKRLVEIWWRRLKSWIDWKSGFFYDRVDELFECDERDGWSRARGQPYDLPGGRWS